MVEHEAVVDALEGGCGVVDGKEFVAYLEAHFLGGTANDDFGDRDGVVNYLESDTYAFEVGLQAFVGALHVLGSDVGAVRVEFGEHSGDGFFADALIVGRFDIVFFDVFVDLFDATEVGGVVVLC